MPASPAYGVFVSQLIRYARACSLYNDFILRARQLATKLLTQGYLKPRLVSTIKKFYGRHYHLVASYTVSVTQLYVTFSKHVKWRLSCTIREHPVLSSGFGDLNRPRISGIHVSIWILKLPLQAGLTDL